MSYRIVNGSLAHEGELPHQVFLTYDDDFACGGVILNSLLILTAAHCLVNRPFRVPQVVAGLHDIDLTNLGYPSEQTRQAEYIILHELFDERTKDNDIAVVVLSSPLQHTHLVQGVPLPAKGEAVKGPVKVSGWGSTRERGPPSSLLRQATVPVVPNPICAKQYKKVPVEIRDEMFCARATGLDSSQGDSGGPAICQSSIPNSTWVLCGVVSFGYGCGRPGYPGVYTRVSSYTEWIGKINEEVQKVG